MRSESEDLCWGVDGGEMRVVGVFPAVCAVCRLMSVPPTCSVYLRGGSDRTTVRAVTLEIEVAGQTYYLPSSQSLLTPGQPVPTPTL